MKTTRQGHTLIEVLIASALFLLVLLLSGELAVMAMRTRTATTDKNQSFRQATICLDALQRDISHATEVYKPDPLTIGTTFEPGESTSVLVLRTATTRVSSGEQVVGYRYQRNQRRLDRILYDPGFDPAAPGTWTPLEAPKAVGSRITACQVQLLDPAQHSGVRLLECLVRVSTVSDEQQTGPELVLATRARLRDR